MADPATNNLSTGTAPVALSNPDKLRGEEVDGDSNFFVAPPPPAYGLAPQTHNAVTGIKEMFGRMDVSPEAKFRQENQREGIPLDMESDIGGWERFRMGWLRDREDKLRFLKEKHGAANVRESEDGRTFIVTKRNEETGTDEDVVVDPPGISWKDAVALLPFLPETLVGGMAGMKAGRSLKAFNIGKRGGLTGVLRDAISSAAGAHVVGGATDAVAKAVSGYDVKPMEILQRRAPQLIADAAVGSGIGVGLGVLKFVKNPWHSRRTSVNINGAASAKYLAEKYGIEEVPLTASEASGSAYLDTVESFTSRVPGGSDVYKKWMEKRASLLDNLKRVIVGESLPDDDVIGRTAIKAIQDTVTPLETAVYNTRREVSEAAMTEIKRRMDAESVAGTIRRRAEVGDAVRTQVQSFKETAKLRNDALWDEVRNLGGNEKNIDATVIADAADQIAKKIATARTPGGTRQIPSSLFDRHGRIMVSDVDVPEQDKVIERFVSRDILGKLRQMQDLRGAKVSIDDIKQMRRRVFDAIESAQANPDIDAHLLSQIGNSLSGAIEAGVKGTGNQALVSALARANKDYVDNILPFNRSGINEMFTTPVDGSKYVGPAEIASWYTGGTKAADRWNALVSVLGAGNPAVRLLKRQIFDDILADSMDDVAGTLNAKKFLNRVARFQADNRDLYEEVFGSAAGEMKRAAGLASLLDDHANVPVEEVRAAIASGGDVAAKLRAAINAQDIREATYNNELIKKVAGRSPEVSKISPDEFVSSVIDYATKNKISSHMSNNQLREVMFAIEEQAPDVAVAIRRKALAKLFARYRDRGGVSVALSDAEKNEGIRALFGDTGQEMFDDLRRVGEIEEATASTKKLGALGGGMAGGQRIASVLRAPLRFVGVKYAEQAIANMLLSSKMRHWVLNTPNLDPRAMWLLMSSPPFLREVADELKDDNAVALRATQFVDALKRGMDDYFASLSEKNKARPILPNNPTPVMPILSDPDKLRDDE